MEIKMLRDFKQLIIKEELFTIYLVLYALVLIMFPTGFVFFVRKYNLFPMILNNSRFALLGMIGIFFSLLVIFRKKITLDRCLPFF